VRRVKFEGSLPLIVGSLEMPNTYCLVLQPKGTVRNAVVAYEQKAATAALAGNILRRAVEPTEIGTWKYGASVIHLYGYKTGKAGTENKHELPPPHDKILLFGEAVLFMTLDTVITSFNEAEYKKWYNTALAGFEELGDEDTDEDEEEDEEEEEEEIEEEVEDEDEEEDKDKEEEFEEEEEEEEVRRPAPKVSKAKRNIKKVPAWYSAPELTAETYTL
jgi:hypothetical protein